MVYSTALEMRRPARDREFESHPLRQKGFCKRELSASLRSAANLYGIFGVWVHNVNIHPGLDLAFSY